MLPWYGAKHSSTHASKVSYYVIHSVAYTKGVLNSAGRHAVGRPP